MNRRIGVLGAGTWGIALARMLAVNGHEVTVWSKFENEVESLSAGRRHPNLPGMVIPDEVAFTTDIGKACREMDVLLFAVPSVFVRQTAEAARPFTPDGQVIVDVAKGIEPNTLLTMTGVIEQVMRADGQHDQVKLVALSGPTHAEEVALDIPTSIVSASKDLGAAELVQDVFMNTCMRTYTNTDVLGVELCGALKNIVALAAGVSAGMGNGDNSRAALITRGMVEITRLGMAMGCMEQTFSGLAGIGDLIVTATSQHSRNNRCGILIGQGMAPDEAIRKVGMVVEGVNALPAALQLARKYGVEMPIVEATNAVVSGGVAPEEMSRALMARHRKAEYVRPAEGKPSVHMHRVMIYGAFDRIDWRQIALLRRAKSLGDHLMVCLETDELTAAMGMRPCAQTYEERSAVLETLRCVDLVIPQSEADQALRDATEYGVQTLAVTGQCEQELERLREAGVETVRMTQREDA